MIKTKLIDTWYHFDSSLGKTITINFPSKKKFNLKISYLVFQLPNNAKYEDLTAYLFIGTSMVSTSVLTQTGKKLHGIVLPIKNPNANSYGVDALANIVFEIPTDLEFSILDKNLKEVPTTRIVATFLLQEQAQ